MAATPIYALPYPVPTDPADVPADIQRLAQRVEVVLPTLGSGAISPTPPASPTDGQLWAFSPATGVVWLFRYTASIGDAYKWVFVGGGPMVAYGPALATLSGVGDSAWTALAGDVSLTVPRDGQYLLECGAQMFPASFAASIWLGIQIGATAPTVDGSFSTGSYSSVASARASLMVKAPTSGIATGTVLSPRYRQTGGGGSQNLTAAGRFLSALPIRVG